MPIYEYECANCHHNFDLIQKMSDDPVTLCPACSKDTAIRLVSAAGFQLKGTGWYATDFKNQNKSEKSSVTSSNGSSEKKKTESSPPTNASKE